MTDAKTQMNRRELELRRAAETLGDLSETTLWQLVTLYDACERATDTWANAHATARLGFVGEDERPYAVVENECARLWDLQELIVAELRRRPAPDEHELERARILVHWCIKTGDDFPELYDEAQRSLALASRSVRPRRQLRQ